MEIDRISSLPDSTLSQILSYLRIDEAVRTKILNKQWRYLWFPTQELVFHQMSRMSSNLYLTGIAEFINRTLPLHTCPKITKYDLRLKETSTSFDKSKFYLGIKAAILRQVRDVVLDHHGACSWRDLRYVDYTLPKKLFSYASLESLTLRHHSPIKACSKICWTSLKTLTIEFTDLDDDTIENILESCPKLEHLELNQCDGFKRIIDADSSCLRKVVIIKVKDFNPMVISLPKVKCLIVKHFGELQFINVSSLVDVTLDFCSSDYILWISKKKMDLIHLAQDDILTELLNKIGHVEKLRLGTQCVKAVSSYAIRGLPSSLSLTKWKCLVLETPLEEWDIPGILSLLSVSPNLEILIVDLTAVTTYKAQFSPGNKIAAVEARTYWKKQINFSEQFLQHLKSVKIVGVSSWLFGFAQFLLQNAKLLEKMEFTKCNENDDQWLVIQNILRLQTSSTNTQILIS